MSQDNAETQDWELVERAKNGEMGAFAELLKRYQVPLVHFCQRMIGSLQDAEDVAQECFVRLYRILPQLKPKAKFTTVLFGIARNLTLNAIRDAERRGRSKTISLAGDIERGEWHLPDETQDPRRAAELGELEQRIQRALLTLAPEHREVILLREVEQMDYEEIARVTGTLVGTVKSRLSRAREQLRLRLMELGGNEP